MTDTVALRQPWYRGLNRHQWNILLANQAALAFVQDLPAYVTEPTVNVFRVCLHPDGLAARTRNKNEHRHQGGAS